MIPAKEQRHQERRLCRRRLKGRKENFGEGRDFSVVVPNYDFLNVLANASTILSFGQVLRGDDIPAQIFLQELIRGGVVGAVNKKAQDRKRCLNFV